MKKPENISRLLADAPARWDGLLAWWRDDDGDTHRMPVGALADIDLTEVAPVRPFTWRKGQTNYPGYLWVATTGRLVGYESHLERGVLLLMDWDPDIVGVVAQPFWVARQVDGRAEAHCPDYFAVRSDGTGVVVDVKPEDKADEDDVRSKADLARAACAVHGWEYRFVTDPDETVFANVNWLAGYRREHHDPLGLAEKVLDACTTHSTVGDLADAAGPFPLTFPWVMHHLWHRRLAFDETTVLDLDTVVWRVHP